MQFGFKADHSTSQCTYVCEEIINHYNKKQSDVYVVLLDASKAFDRVNHINLFSIECHLGNIIGPNIMNSRIKRSTDDLYMRTNQLLSSFGFMKGNVKRKLFNSFCMAVYGSQLWDYSTNAPEHFIPRGGNVSGALMDYLIKLIKLYYLCCGMLNPYMFNSMNVL